jgi:hypothetical protein
MGIDETATIGLLHKPRVRVPADPHQLRPDAGGVREVLLPGVHAARHRGELHRTPLCFYQRGLR